MKKLIILLVLLSSVYADYKVTQVYSRGPSKSWVTSKYGGMYGGSSLSVINSVKFINKKDGKIVIVSAPFRIEEL